MNILCNIKKTVILYFFLVWDMKKTITSIFFLLTGFSVILSNDYHMKNFNYSVDKFADIEVLRYQVPGFEDLTLKQKEYIYYLSQAAVEGRDILFDQNYSGNIPVREVLEGIYLNYEGDQNSEDFKQFEIYLKRVWFANGIHHHYSMDKFVPGFSKEFFIEAYNTLIDEKMLGYIYSNQPDPCGSLAITKESLLNEILLSVIFNPHIAAKRVNQTQGEDLIITSANNYYNSVTQKNVEEFYNAVRNPNDPTPISYGLNSRLMQDCHGNFIEQIWKIDGMYTNEIEKIVYWLEKAKTVAENDQQKNIISLLIDFYTTGDLKTFDEYSIAWVQDTDSHIDFLNGFIETYGDPLGIKASWEAIVNFKNTEATKRTEIISANAQWFEDNSPVDKRFKKEKVRGVSAKVITVAMLGGDCYPSSPLGINLPNSNWIREMHGSKSVTIENIAQAHNEASKGNGFLEEFVYSEEERNLIENYGFITDNLHTDLHECLGHGSGKLLPGVSQDALKAYGAVIEEARADLFALYYIADPKMVELGLLPNHEAYKAAYYKYMMNGLMTQLVRIELGNDIQQTHMRNRQMIAKAVFQYDTTNTLEFTERDDKTFIKINDYEALRKMFGQLLTEIQRIKSEGDYEMATHLVETFGVDVNQDMHIEIFERYKKLDIAPYKGFVNPRYFPVYNEKGEIIDITIDYSEGFVEQHLRLGGN